MAQRTTVVLIDDITGEEIPEGKGGSVTFAVDGVEYRIDLSDKELKKFNETMVHYTEHAERVSRKRGKRERSDKVKPDTMRQWGKEHGYKVSDRGRVSQEVQEAYRAAH